MKQFPLLLMPLMASVCSAEPAGVTITLTMPDPAALHIQYDVPPSCGELVFHNHDIAPADAQSMRAGWQAMDACTRTDAARITRAPPPAGPGAQDGACASLRVRVPAAAVNLDRVYPWAYPVGAGLYAHTSAFAVTDACGPVRWRVAAPGGAVVADGQPLGESGALPPGAAQAMPLLFLPSALPAGVRHYADPALPAPLMARIGAIGARVERWLGAAMPNQPYQTPFTVAGIAPAGTWRGDVANRTLMRLAFPAQPDDRVSAELPGFLAHELAHVAQPAAYPDDRGETAMLAEGGAEFLRWSAEAQLGWRAMPELHDQLERAINNCIAMAAGKPWRGVTARQHGRLPYDCGLAFHVLALAARGQSASGTALAALDSYYTAARHGAAVATLECAGKAGCAPRWLPALAYSDTPLDTVLADYARQHRWLLPADGVPAGLERQLGFAAFNALMAADCDGPGYFSDPQGPRIAYSRNCKSLRDGMRIMTVEGRALVTDPGAPAALAHACRTHGKVALGLHDGATLEVPCDSRVPTPPRFYSIDMPPLLARLGIGLPPAVQRP